MTDRRWSTILLLLVLVVAAFLLGRVTTRSTWAEPSAHAGGVDGAVFGDRAPQGRQPPRTVPPAGQPTTPSTPAPLVFESGGGTAGGTNGFVAVTGSYGVGTSVLYVLDTESRQLAVYEARGGAAATRRLTLVGARRIDLDLQLEGYNDESEYSYDRLRALFEGRGQSPANARRAVDRSGDSGLERR
jgi:hypothetical protein